MGACLEETIYPDSYSAYAMTGRDGSYALVLDGTESYVEFPEAVTEEILGDNPRTICLWAVIESFEGDGGLFDYGSASNLAMVGLRTTGTNSTLMVQVWAGDQEVTLSGSEDGGWHHYCLTYDGAAWVLYFDGSQAATDTAALDTGSDRPLRLGTDWSLTQFFKGAIDELYIYSSALDAASVQSLYEDYYAHPTAVPTSTKQPSSPLRRRCPRPRPRHRRLYRRLHRRLHRR